mgnify:CR=1 FL=1
MAGEAFRDQGQLETSMSHFKACEEVVSTLDDRILAGLRDLLAGLDMLVEEGIADPERVAIAGGSFGGYSTLAGLTMFPELYACGADIVGPSNLITLLETHELTPYFMSIDKAKFRRVVVPGDQLTIDVQILLREPFAQQFS